MIQRKPSGPHAVSGTMRFETHKRTDDVQSAPRRGWADSVCHYEEESILRVPFFGIRGLQDSADHRPQSWDCGAVRIRHQEDCQRMAEALQGKRSRRPGLGPPCSFLENQPVTPARPRGMRREVRRTISCWMRCLPHGNGICTEGKRESGPPFFHFRIAQPPGSTRRARTGSFFWSLFVRLPQDSPLPWLNESSQELQIKQGGVREILRAPAVEAL